MTKKQNILLKASIAIAVLFAIAPASNAMHIMEGYLPAAFCIAWGVICLPFIVAGFFFHSENIKTEQKNTDPSGNVRSLCVCDLFLEDPVCDRKLFPYDRNRTGCDFIRAYGSRRVGADRVTISGNPAGTRRTDHAGSQYIFYGDRRSVSFLWDL